MAGKKVELLVLENWMMQMMQELEIRSNAL